MSKFGIKNSMKLLEVVFMSDVIRYSGKLFQVIDRTMEDSIYVEGKTVMKQLQLEIVRRPPGVRALVVKKDKLLLTREYRYELKRWDYRLPGGKVFDSNDDYCSEMVKGNMMENVICALKKELREETAIEVSNYSLQNISHCGLTVEWDLYYFVVDQFICHNELSIQKSEYEYIQTQWVDFSTAIELCFDGSVSEGRSACEILRYILKSRKSI